VSLRMAPRRVNLKRLCTEYWLSSIKIATVIIFIITGTLVDGGLNREHKPLGLVNWTIGDAPFVGGLSGFATVFVAAAMSCRH
jgi:amino acid transporter, AAT family